MTGEVKVHGIVLSSMPIGEYDRRITILTAEKGKISAFAKGARKPTSAFSACSQGFTYGEFSLYEGRDSYNLMRIEHPNYFSELRTDLDGMYYGMYFCELAGSLTREGADEEGQLKLLYVALLALTKGIMPKQLIRSVYELRCMAEYGEAPVAEGRLYSGRRNGLVNDVQVGSGSGNNEFMVSESTLYTVQYIIGTPVKKLFGFTVSDEVLGELTRICKDFMERHMDRPLRSLEMLGDGM